MNLSYLLESFRDFAQQQLLGIAIASTVLGLVAMIVVGLVRRQNAAARFLVWQSAVSGTLLSFLILLGVPGIPLRTVEKVGEKVGEKVAEKVAENHAANASPPMTTYAPNADSQIEKSNAVREANSTNALPLGHNPNESGEKVKAEVRPKSNPDANVFSKPAQPVIGHERFSESPETGKSIDGKPITNEILSTAGANQGKQTQANLAPASLVDSRLVIAVVLIWATVMLIKLFWFAACVVRCNMIAFRARDIDCPMAIKALQNASQRIDGRLKNVNDRNLQISLRTSPEVSVPITVGILRSAIVMPEQFVNWSPAQLEMVLAHEVAHVRRHDVAWLWLNRISVCLAWFNPLVWLAVKKSILERERACDDVVIRSGFSATEYGQVLVDIAAQSRQRLQMAGSVSMAEPPLKQRLQRILSPETNRHSSTLIFQLSIAGCFAAIALAIGVVRPMAVVHVESRVATHSAERSSEGFNGKNDESVKAANRTPDQESNDNDQAETFKMIDKLGGLVLGEDQKPLEGANVDVRIFHYPDSENKRGTAVIKTWSVKTDAEGRYTIETGKIGQIPNSALIRLDRVGHPTKAESGQKTWRAQKVSEYGKFDPIVLDTGRVVSGTVVDTQQKPIRAIIRAAGGNSKPMQAWFPQPFYSDENGKFNLRVPSDYQVELMAIAPGHVAKRIIVPGYKVKPVQGYHDRSITYEELKVINGTVDPNGNAKVTPDTRPFDAGQIQLSEGCTVKGRLVDDADNPVVGVVVAMETARDCEIPGVGFGINYACVSDEEGRFEFPPASGKCIVCVKDRVMISNRIDETWVSGKKAPHVNSLELNLDSDTASKEITLRTLNATQKVSGSVKFDNGTPAVGVEVVASISPNVKIGSVLTDKNGNYEIELPRPLIGGGLRVLGARDERGVWHRAVGFRSSNGQIGDVRFDRLDGDESGVNWTLRESRTYDYDQGEYEKARADYVQLLKREHELQQTYYQALKDAKNADEKEQVIRELNPGNEMAAQFLAFEEKHRGKPAAFLAIVSTINTGLSGAGIDSKSAQAREEITSRLIRHYLDNEDLPSIFDEFGDGLSIEQRDKILDFAMKHSVHRQTRAQAILYRVFFAMQTLQQAEMIGFNQKYSDTIGSMQAADYPHAWVERARQQQQMLEQIDQIQLRSQAKKWLDVLETVYGDVRVNTNGRFLYQQINDTAKRLRFALTNIEIGKAVPDFKLIDQHGDEISLSDYRGKPVVLTWCFPNGPKLRYQDLAAKYADRDVQFLTIVSVHNSEEFKKQFPIDELHGVVAVEPSGKGEFQRRWFVNSPTIFLIDEEGILRCHDAEKDSVEKWIETRGQ